MRRWQFIDKLVKENEWAIGAELGVWTGKTFTYLLTNNPQLDLVGVDLYETQPYSGGETYVRGENGHEWDHKRYYLEMQQFVAKLGRGSILKTYTTEAANKFPDRHFDFVFVDAQHTTEAVLEDVLAWWPKIKFGGMLIGHDIDWPSVKTAVDMLFPKYSTGPDNLWFVNKLHFNPITPLRGQDLGKDFGKDLGKDLGKT